MTSLKTNKIELKIVTVITFFFCCTIAFLGAPSVNAQTPEPGLVNISISPQHPEPGQLVTVQVRSSFINIGNSTITWNVDGAPHSEGVGVGSIEIAAGNVGSKTTVSVRVTDPSGRTGEDTMIISPASIRLIWETDSTTPPFYKGKALRPPFGDVRVIAEPLISNSDGTLQSRSELVYRWRINGRVVGSVSGKGRYRYDGPLNIDGTTRVGVEVVSSSGDVVASDEVAIKTTDPSVFLYRDDPLLGIRFGNILADNVSFLERETTIVAYPYFISGNNALLPSLEYSWKINNSPIAEPSTPYKLTVRQEGSSGAANISLTVDHPNRTFQRAAESIRVRLEAEDDRETGEEVDNN